MIQEIVITCRVNPSEDTNKLVKAILNIFPEAEIIIKDSEVSGKTNLLETLKEKMRNQKIRSAARAHLQRCVTGGEVIFYLNKQVALAGGVNFADRDIILGGIEVRIRTNNPEELIAYLTDGEWST